MKTRTTLITASMTVLLAASGSAFAAGEGGGSASDRNPADTGSGAAANGVYPAPTQGVENGVTAGHNSTMRTQTQTQHRMHTRHHAKKPVNDTTNMPGADASSDTKGQ
jgi:hypothetical protein